MEYENAFNHPRNSEGMLNLALKTRLTANDQQSTVNC
jgi:hypothetical protein